MDFAFYWSHTDAVSKTLFFILLALSLVSWVVGIVRLVQSKQMAGTIDEQLNQAMKSIEPELAGLEFNQKKDGNRATTIATNCPPSF